MRSKAGYSGTDRGLGSLGLGVAGLRIGVGGGGIRGQRPYTRVLDRWAEI